MLQVFQGGALPHPAHDPPADDAKLVRADQQDHEGGHRAVGRDQRGLPAGQYSIITFVGVFIIFWKGKGIQCCKKNRAFAAENQKLHPNRTYMPAAKKYSFTRIYLYEKEKKKTWKDSLS